MLFKRKYDKLTTEIRRWKKDVLKKHNRTFYGKFEEKIKHFIYDTSKKILNTGVKKTGIYISDYYGVITEFGPEELGKEDDDVIFF